MDPVQVDNPMLKDISEYLSQVLNDICDGLSFHDLRIVPGKTHTNVIFDVLMSPDCRISESNTIAIIRSKVSEKYGDNYFCVIKLERSYI